MARPRPKRLDDREWLEKAYAIASCRLIGVALGCSLDTVHSALVRHRIPIRPQGTKAHAYAALNDRDWLAKQLESTSVGELAILLSVSRKTIYRACKALDITLIPGRIPWWVKSL